MKKPTTDAQRDREKAYKLMDYMVSDINSAWILSTLLRAIRYGRRMERAKLLSFVQDTAVKNFRIRVKNADSRDTYLFVRHVPSEGRGDASPPST